MASFDYKIFILPAVVVIFIIYRSILSSRIGNAGDQKPGPRTVILSFFWIGFLIVTAAVLNMFRVNISRSGETEFTASDFLRLAAKFNIDDIAGECTKRDFFIEPDQAKNIDGWYDIYQYFYIGKNPERKDIDHIRAYGDKEKEIKESVILYSNTQCIYYFVSNEDKYLAFIASLEDVYHPEDYNKQVHPDFSDAKYYMIDSVVIIKDRFNRQYQGYGVYFIPERELSLINQKIRDDSIIAANQAERIEVDKRQKLHEIEEKKREMLNEFYQSTNATVVYSTHVYDQNYQTSKYIGTVAKNSRVRIIKNDYNKFYCDYISQDSLVKSGWLEESDVIKDPIPKTEEELHREKIKRQVDSILSTKRQ